MASKRALIILAAGCEEIEAVVTIDVLRRGGVEVIVAGLTGTDLVKCARETVIKPETSLDDALKKSPFDAIILPGGKAAETLAQSSTVGEALKVHFNGGKICAAICAGPISFPANKLGYGKKITSHFTVKDKFSDYKYVEERVVQDGNMITSQGPGTAMEFALKLVEVLQGKPKADELVKPLVFKC